MDAEVIIAGAGPGGVTCAAALLKRDPSLKGRIILLDRARFPREKPCGGGLTGHAEEAMAKVGLELAVPHQPSARAVVQFAGIRRTVELGRPVKVVRRQEFDRSLVEQAQALGAEVRQATPLEEFTVTAKGVEVMAGGRALSARVLVGADGVASRVRQHIRGGGATAPGRVAGTLPLRLFRLELEAPRAGLGDTMLYDFTPMADGLRGYLWIFPVPGGRINVGLMHYPSQARGGRELVELLARHLRGHGIELPAAARGWPAWGYAPAAPVGALRLLTIGDAAGIDALTGEGIAVAMEQALVAADAILEARARDDFRFSRYRRALRHATVGRELALDGWLARLLYGAKSWRTWLSLVLFDPRMLELYAARISGSLVLADHKQVLLGALFRHLLVARRRRRALTREAHRSQPRGDTQAPD